MSFFHSHITLGIYVSITGNEKILFCWYIFSISYQRILSCIFPKSLYSQCKNSRKLEASSRIFENTICLLTAKEKRVLSSEKIFYISIKEILKSTKIKKMDVNVWVPILVHLIPSYLTSRPQYVSQKGYIWFPSGFKPGTIFISSIY